MRKLENTVWARLASALLLCFIMGSNYLSLAGIETFGWWSVALVRTGALLCLFLFFWFLTNLHVHNRNDEDMFGWSFPGSIAFVALVYRCMSDSSQTVQSDPASSGVMGIVILFFACCLVDGPIQQARRKSEKVAAEYQNAGERFQLEQRLYQLGVNASTSPWRLLSVSELSELETRIRTSVRLRDAGVDADWLRHDLATLKQMEEDLEHPTIVRENC
jgi:hypothetical protein